MKRNRKDTITGCVVLFLGFVCFILAGAFGVELMNTVDARIAGADIPDFVFTVVILAAIIALSLVSAFVCWFASIKIFRHEI